jgi:4'-phosphopantetheinyl transferase
MIETFDCKGLDSTTSNLLPDGKVHLWRAFTTDWLSRIEALQDFLSSHEVDRARRFHFERDRLRYIVAHGLLRMLIGRYLGIPAHRIEFRSGPFGKPELHGHHSASSFSFNISHSHELTVFAFSSYGCLGVDVEYVRPMPDFEAIVSGYFHPRERVTLRGFPPHERQTAFFDCWTRKEAFIKATGEGLHRPLDSFAVPMDSGNARDFLTLNDGAAMDERWAFLPLRPARRYTGAVVVGKRRHAAEPISYLNIS